MRTSINITLTGILIIFLILATVNSPATANSKSNLSNIQSDSLAIGEQIESTGQAATDSRYPTLSDVRVRQAIAYCTDRRALAQAVYPTLTDPEIDTLMMDSFLAKDHWAYTEPTVKYPFNPDQGKSLLEQAGWTLPISATYRTNPAGEELAIKLTTTQASLRYAWAEALEGQLLNCGIHLLRFHAAADWAFADTSGFSRRDFELAGFAWVQGSEVEAAITYACDRIPSKFNGWYGQNFMGWCNPAASAAAHLGDNTALTQTERKAYYATVQQAYASDMPALPLFLRYPIDGTWEHLDMNFSSPPPPTPVLQDVRVRQAIAYCTDRQALAKAAYPALTDPEIDTLMMDSFLPKDHWAYTEPTIKYPFDPDQGKSLLEQAGWTLPISATYRTNPAGEELAIKLTTTQASLRYAWAEALEGQLLNCGIHLLRFHAAADWAFADTSGFSRRDFELAGFAWVQGSEVEAAITYACDRIPSKFNGWYGQNFMGWCNPAASAAAHLGDNTALTQTERKAYYATVQQAYASDVPALPLFLRYPIDGTWEHLDMNIFYSPVEVYIPFTNR